MPQALRVFRIVLVSPQDVEPDWRVVEKVVDELNEGLAAELNLLLRISTWKTDAYPGFHVEGPQNLVDESLRLDTADVLLGIFWTRFGTPVGDSKSGTEHEIHRAVKLWHETGRPNVMVYFKDTPYNPRSQAELEQWTMVRDFRACFPIGGLWRAYSTRTLFEAQIRRDLTNLLRTQSRRAIAKRHARQSSRRMTIDSVEPPPYAAAFLTIPRLQSQDENRYTLNIMLSNLSSSKLTDYDVELAFPSKFLLSEHSDGVDEHISTADITILRVPMPANTLPPPVFPGQTRNILSVQFAIHIGTDEIEEALLNRVISTIRFGDGRSLKLDTLIRDLHESLSQRGNRKLIVSRRQHRKEADVVEDFFRNGSYVGEVSFRGDASSSEAFNPLNFGLRHEPRNKR